MARALGAIRLSVMREDDPTSSPVVQRKSILSWCSNNGHGEPIGWAEDLDESAYKVGPFARPDLGDWLNYKAKQYDLIVWASLDRAVRRMADMSALADWARRENKVLVFVRGPGGDSLILDMRKSNPIADLIVLIYAFAAEMEAYNDRERVIASRAYLRMQKRYAGGWTPFGYAPVSLGKGKGYALVPDKYADTLRDMVSLTLKGIGPSEIAERLNADHIPTSKDILRIRKGKPAKGLTWKYPAVIGILRSRAMCGITELDGKVVRGEDGEPIQFGEPIIDYAIYERVQRALDKLSKPHNRQRKDSPWLVGASVCNACGGNLWAKHQVNHGKDYHYMVCANVRYNKCSASRQMRQDAIEAKATEIIGKRWPTLPYMISRTIEGINHAPEMATVQAAIKDIAGDIALAEAMGEDARDNRVKLDILKARLVALRNMPDEPDRIVFEDSGITIPQHWANLDGRGRHAMLVSHKAKIKAEMTDHGLVVDIDPGTLVPATWAKLRRAHQ